MNGSLEKLFNAILEDDAVKVKGLLKSEPLLAGMGIGEARLYESKIFHWIYVGDTALHLAAAGYRVEIAKALLGAGADPNAAMNHRRSRPLHYAADGHITGPAWNEARQMKMIQCLIDAGAHLDAQDKNGASPLHRAVRTRCAAAVRVLLENGCDATLKNKPGSTAFHLAVQNTGRGGAGAADAKAAQREIVKLFLSKGLKPNLKDRKGKTVFESAKSDWIKELLR